MHKKYIYLINAINLVGYASYESFCVVADSELEARTLANNNGGEESCEWDNNSTGLFRIDTKFWLDPLKSEIELIGIYTGSKTESFILIGSFNA